MTTIKALGSVEIKDAEQGTVEALFSTLDVMDLDKDVTLKGAFKDGAPVRISAYNHKSWEGALPVGKGTIHEVGDQVVLKGQFFLNTTHGRDTFETIKAMGDLGEWSYGFDVVDSEPGEFKGQRVRYLKELTVHEVSPVLRGAGIGTRTLVTKGAGTLNEEIAAAVDAANSAIESADRVVALRAEKGKSLSNVNSESLDGLRKTLERLETLLKQETTESEEQPDNSAELRAEYLRSIAADYQSEGE